MQGSNFLLHLERVVGGVEYFVPYMKDYYQAFKHTSVTSGQWKAHLFMYSGRQANAAENLKELEQVDFEEAYISPDLCIRADECSGSTVTVLTSV